MMISLCVQHHPSRADLLTRLDELGEYELVTDPEPYAPHRSAFRTYLECLRRTPADATHRLIVQDDALPCARFRALAAAAVGERPGDLIAFFVPGRSSLRDLIGKAHALGHRWVQLPNLNWTPTVALCWPVARVHEFIPYGEAIVESRAKRGMPTMADDPYVGAWRKREKIPVWATVPCLVQHPDVVQSLYRCDLRPRAGENRSRVAALYVDDIGAVT